MKRNKMGTDLHADRQVTEKHDIIREVMMLHTIHLSRKIITKNMSWQSEMREC